MNINILSTQRLRKSFVKEALEEYSKRLSRYCHLTLIMEKNQEQLLRRIDDKTYLFWINNCAPLISSEELAQNIEHLAISGINDIAFYISSSDITASRANIVISISRMELDFDILLIILYEQIYRAYKIIKTEPYHR